VVKGDRERLIPFVLDSVVREVNLAEQRLLVDWHEDD
ncbi:MAG: ribosome maturation factor RimM, partial [Xanthomonadales bacterium]|nr:ribosome maturation factor RimM [Xanthomonadales bacterium]